MMSSKLHVFFLLYMIVALDLKALVNCNDIVYIENSENMLNEFSIDSTSFNSFKADKPFNNLPVKTTKTKITQSDKDFFYKSEDIRVSNVYPNPANDYAQFDYTLSNRNVQAYIIVHDVLGGNIGEFILPAYDRQLRISTSNINPGVYFYTLRLGNENVITKKMVIRR